MNNELKNTLIYGTAVALISFIISLVLFIKFNKYSILVNVFLSFSIAVLAWPIIGLIYFKKWETLFSSIIFAIITGLVLSFIFPLILIPKTEIEVSCTKNFSEGYITFIFENLADFVGEDFNIDIIDKNITQKASFYPWVGKLCDSYFIISDIVSRINIGLRIKCQYIPPKTTLPFNVHSNSIKDSYKIQYYSKTTKFTEKEVICK